MENKSRLVYFLLLAVVCLGIIVGAIYFIVGLIRGAPEKTITPQGYEKGVTVDIYKSVPAGFPGGIILENKPLDYSGTVNRPDGKKVMTVSYISDKSMLDVLSDYTTSLPKKGWKIESSNISQNTAVMLVSKNSDKVFVSIAPVGKSGVMVSFQYEK